MNVESFYLQKIFTEEEIAKLEIFHTQSRVKPENGEYNEVVEYKRAKCDGSSSSQYKYFYKNT